MSIKVSLHYWDQAQISNHTEKLILLALADWCNDDGTCFPSIRKIAVRCSLSDRGVQKVIARLVETGHLRVEENAGVFTGRGSSTHRYHLLSYQAAHCTECDAQESEKGERGSQRVNMVTEKGEQGSPLKGERCSQRVNAVPQRVNVVTEKGEPMRSPDPALDPPIDPSEGERERAQTDPPTALSRFPDILPIELVPAVTTPKKPTVVKAQGPHMPAGMRLPGGYVPAGQGQNPVQVYYERFNYGDPDARLNRPQEDDLARLCPDLDKLREVITAYSRTNYRPGNIQLILDWYRNGAPGSERRPSKSAGYGRPERGGTSPRKGKTDAIDQDMLEFIRDFRDARDGTSALAAD